MNGRSPYLGNLREAVVLREAAPVQWHAHALKSSPSGLSARRARKLATALEQKGRAGDLEGAASALEPLEHEAALGCSVGS